jgi:uncharacterized membrane protein
MENYSNPKRVHIVTGLITLILGVLLVKLGWDDFRIDNKNKMLLGPLKMSFLKDWRVIITTLLGIITFGAGLVLTSNSAYCEQYFITKKWGTCY